MAVAATNPGAFGKRGTLALVLFAILAFVGFLFLVGQGGLSGSANNGRAHAAGTGLSGFAGLTRLLEADGTGVIRSRDRAALDSPGLLVLTPPPEVDTEELAGVVDRRRTIGPTLIVAPKWFAMPLGEAADQPGWVALLGAYDSWSLELGGQTYDLAADKELARAPRWQGLSQSGRLPSDQVLLHVEGTEGDDDSAGLAPLVRDGEGRVLAAHLADDGSFMDGDLYLDPGRGDGRPVYGVMLVAEPDLLNNWGLADRRQAALALQLVETARQGTEAPVRFDLTFNGLGASRNLLTLAFEPPFLAATLTLLLALAIAMWRAFSRFGPAVRAAPAIAPGKSQLVANGAQVLARSGRLRLLRKPYEDMMRTRIARRLGLRESETDDIESALAARGSPSLDPILANLRDARGAGEILRAARSLRDLERTLRR